MGFKMKKLLLVVSCIVLSQPFFANSYNGTKNDKKRYDHAKIVSKKNNNDVVKYCLDNPYKTCLGGFALSYYLYPTLNNMYVFRAMFAEPIKYRSAIFVFLRSALESGLKFGLAVKVGSDFDKLSKKLTQLTVVKNKQLDDQEDDFDYE